MKEILFSVETHVKEICIIFDTWIPYNVIEEINLPEGAKDTTPSGSYINNETRELTVELYPYDDKVESKTIKHVSKAILEYQRSYKNISMAKTKRD